MEKNIILLILIIIIICVILIFFNKEKFNDYEIKYTEPQTTNGDCKSLSVDVDNNYTNWKAMTFVDNLNDRCKLECDNERLCKGYSINSTAQENNCKLYGSIYDNIGNYNNLDLLKSDTNMNDGWTCKIKKFKNKFRFYKLIINDIREKVIEGGNYLVQISEIKFYDINKVQIIINNNEVSVTNPLAINPIRHIEPIQPIRPEMSCPKKLLLKISWSKFKKLVFSSIKFDFGKYCQLFVLANNACTLSI